MSLNLDSFFGTTAPPLPGAACASILSSRLFGSDNSACHTDSGYYFDDLTPPSANDIPFICKSAACKTLVEIARSVSPNECVANQKYYLYGDILNPIIRLCTNSTTPQPSTNSSGNATPTPARTGEVALAGNWTVPPTTTPKYTPSPNITWFENKSHNMFVYFICGVCGLILMAGITSFCRSRKRSPVRRAPQPQYLVHGHQDPAPTPSVAAVFIKIEGDDARGPTTGSTIQTLPSPVPSRQSKPRSPVPSPTPPRQSKSKPSAASQSSSSSDAANRDSSSGIVKIALFNDQQIVAVRVPYDKIVFGTRISQGGFGQVYKGTYKDETVAIKTMLPAHRNDARLVEKFLSEIRLTSSLEHERIVRFVGVAWTSKSDVCVLSEFMEGGDLRSLLARYEDENRPEGVDKTKIQIALHVAYALTYMHSLQPVVLHRDLKSSNILLSADLNAKLADFGVSRERAEATMTRGVGTSLWMAPGIMMGGRYDEKADIFSFGVVLSELDSNKLPYASQVNVKDPRVNYGELMQSVAQGRVTVDFSYESDPDIVALGRDCVAIDPRDRPTAAQALHRIHVVLQQYTVV